jgi:hypothetical protein
MPAAKMSNPENIKFCDFTSTNNNDFICTPMAPPAPEATFYEIKPALLNLVMKEQFSGVSTDDAVAHLNNFVELCEMQKYKDGDGDIIKLKLFPFSLRGRAKYWLLSLPRCSWITVYVLYCNTQVNLIVILMTCTCIACIFILSIA